MRRRGFQGLAAVAVTLGLAACGSLGGTATQGAPATASGAPATASGAPATASGAPMKPAPMKLSVQNGTTVVVTLVVNGTVVETFPPGAFEDPIKAELPPLPWSVETRSPSGRVLSRMTVKEGDYVTSNGPTGGMVKGDAVRVDLSCGRLDVWYGPPLLGGTLIPGPSGDCG